jgi:hypothetical protein
MKKLFIYYSKGGNGDLVTAYLKEKENLDIKKLILSITFLKSFPDG